MANAIGTQISQEQIHEEKRTADLLSGGAVVLAIIGLVGAFPGLLLSISVIGLGGALLLEGASISARFYNLLSETAKDKFSIAELGLGTTAESFAGAAGVTLGILSLLRVMPIILIPSGIIVIGGCLILGAGANARLNHLGIGIRMEEHPHFRAIAREAVLASTSLQLLVGLGGITLGILALSGIEPLILSLTGVLVLSSSMLLSGSSIASRMASLFFL